MNMSEKIRVWARGVKFDGVTLWFAYKHANTPLMAKLLCMFVVAYALSPIDLIPDFIPVIGYLDDLLIVPLGLALVVRLTPPEVIESARQQAAHAASRPVSYAAATAIVLLWLLLAAVMIRWLGAVLGFSGV